MSFLLNAVIVALCEVSHFFIQTSTRAGYKPLTRNLHNLILKLSFTVSLINSTITEQSSIRLYKVYILSGTPLIQNTIIEQIEHVCAAITHS